MGLILKLLAGTFGPFIAGAVAALVLGLGVWGGVQTWKLAAANRATAEAYHARDRAVADYERCKVNRITIEDATKRQSAAVEAVRAEGAARIRAASAALHVADRARAAAQARAAGLLRPPVGADACARMESADRAVLEAIQ